MVYGQRAAGADTSEKAAHEPQVRGVRQSGEIGQRSFGDPLAILWSLGGLDVLARSRMSLLTEQTTAEVTDQ
jgi:hypothetical protein